ncbi:sigma-70 family RNA polymerase sigma factor [Rhizobium sp. PL01]|uniref:sigma-70 family RNA polymerase sigma factor n=1 Tax=Rhizobium sp. PL01 TaxID=3085631 RepID=UPI002980B769|nr:sigma-70 family RNA polymerase sigma factor [Rhizobium sp. PL01]MDW5315859.1 sigma-70 family RNA polymerase sigma factor [Rhizobium sp. PL01]
MKTTVPAHSDPVEQLKRGNVIWLPATFNRRIRHLDKPRQGVDEVEITRLLTAVAERGDVDAFEMLYNHFMPKIRAYMSKIGGKGISAEEMAQEAMLKVWKKAKLFDPERGQASTWIFTIARNVRIDALRRGPRPDFDPNDPAFVPDDTPAADTALDRFQEAERLRAAMASLRPDEVKALKLSFFEDMTHPDIAATLGIPIGTVKSRIRNACLKLRALLKDA